MNKELTKIIEEEGWNGAVLLDMLYEYVEDQDDGVGFLRWLLAK